jgi:hypothetical protein
MSSNAAMLDFDIEFSSSSLKSLVEDSLYLHRYNRF